MNYDLFLTEVAKEENMNIQEFLNLETYWADILIWKHQAKAKNL